ncbi:MAG: hypothetical protein ACLPYS_14940 [Vulcanimicrobiaceae bacterium]
MRFSLGRCTVALSAALGVTFPAGCLPRPVPVPIVSPSPPPAAPSPAVQGSPGASVSAPPVTSSPAPASSAPAQPVATAAAAAVPSFSQLASDATDTLLQRYFDPRGGWKLCPDPVCPSVNRDWGVDSLTYTLYLRWKTTRDNALVPPMNALIATAPNYPPPCRGLTGVLCTWSDVANWDAVADMREFEATGGNLSALGNAINAFETVEQSNIYTGGACKAIRYQQPYAYLDRIKTLETEATAVKAALLLFDATGQRRYLDLATKHYTAARLYFLDRYTPLYTAFVFDRGGSCTQLPRRFFASVNGEMISDGIGLFHATGNGNYFDQAVATANAVDSRLSDPNGVFADLLADNDVAEPLVEAMYQLASDEGLRFARSWLLRNAAAAASSRKPDGSYPRFFDGPPAPGTVTAWQTNGGFSLMIAAAALAPSDTPASVTAWDGASTIKDTISKLPATLHFTGSGIALIGTLGDLCCQPGHARVFIDGRETFDETGIWQNSSSALRRFPGSVLFAWRWPTAGAHTLRFEPGKLNLKEGFSYLHSTSYVLAR